MTTKLLRLQHGVALFEAIVALGVMAFGMLGVAAMQASLRQNADVARQRAEAVRLAQESIEAMRSFSVVSAAAGRTAYADTLAPIAAEDVVRANMNTTFTRTVFVAPNVDQNRKTVDVTVAWTDRVNQAHQIRLSSIIHRVPPELSAALVVPGFGTAAQRAMGRHPSIPPSAIPNPDGTTSTFSPPQPAGPNPITWIFNNATGVITQRCTGSTCDSSIYGRLLSGYVAFSLGTVQPTAAQAEAPTSSSLPLGIEVVNRTLPSPLGPATPPECFAQTVPASPPTPDVRAYFCLIYVLAADSHQWSARAQVTGLTPTLATSHSDPDPAKYRVCRYTPYRNDNAVGTGTPPITNGDHPYNYSNVDRNLVSQNFLVIRAGDGASAFDCPPDVVPTPPALNLINSNTWHHQPPGPPPGP